MQVGDFLTSDLEWWEEFLEVAESGADVGGEEIKKRQPRDDAALKFIPSVHLEMKTYGEPADIWYLFFFYIAPDA